MFKPSQGKHTPVLAVYSPQFLEKPNTRRVPMGYQILPTSSYLSSYVLHMFFICSPLWQCCSLCVSMSQMDPVPGPDLAPGRQSPDHDPARLGPWTGSMLVSLDAHGYINNTLR